MARWCDALLFIVRQDYTRKEVFSYATQSLVDNGITNAAIVVNDINNRKTRYGYGYGYGNYGYGRYGRYGKSKYGYGYGYGYGSYKDNSHGYYTEN